MTSSSRPPYDVAAPSSAQSNVPIQKRTQPEVRATHATDSELYVFPHRSNRPTHLPQVKGPLPPDIIIDPQGLFFCFVCRTHVPGGTPNLTQHLQGKRHAFSNRQFASPAQKEAVRAGYLEAAAQARVQERQNDTGKVDSNRADGKEKRTNISRQPATAATGPRINPPVEGSSSRGTAPLLLFPAASNGVNTAPGSSVMGREIGSGISHQQTKAHLPRRNVAKSQGLLRKDRKNSFPSPRAQSLSRSEEMSLSNLSVGRSSPKDNMDLVNSEDEEVSVPCNGNCVRMKHLTEYLKIDKGGNPGVLLTRQQVYEGHGERRAGGSSSSGNNLGVQGTPSRVCKARSDGTPNSRRRLNQTASRSRIICRFAPPLFHAAATGDFASRRSGIASAILPDGKFVQNRKGIYKAVSRL